MHGWEPLENAVKRNIKGGNFAGGNFQVDNLNVSIFGVAIFTAKRWHFAAISKCIKATFFQGKIEK